RTMGNYNGFNMGKSIREIPLRTIKVFQNHGRLLFEGGARNVNRTSEPLNPFEIEKGGTVQPVMYQRLSPYS
ncbi:MAG: hypothetical protein ACI92Z_002602, partial [Paracoccaceae bacterium]